MKDIKLLIITFTSILLISAQIPNCRNLKVVSASFQKIIPGYKGSKIKEKYIFICKKNKSANISITKLWKENAKKGRFIDFKVFKYDSKIKYNEEISNLLGIKTFAIVGTYEYSVDIANNQIKNHFICPIKDFEGKAIIVYEKNNKIKLLKILKMEKTNLIMKR